MPQQSGNKAQAKRPRETSASELLSRGWRFRQLKQRDQATALCRAVLNVEPDNGQAWHLLGILDWDCRDYSKAIRHLEQAISVDPDQPRHYNNLGVILNDMNRHDEAADQFHEALKIDPDYLDAKNNLGIALLRQHRLDKAEEIIEQVANSDPTRAAAWSNLALICLTRNDYSKAISYYRQAIALDGTQSQWHGNLGCALMADRKFDEAVICLRRAMVLDPENPDLLIHLSIALRDLGEHAEAIKALKHAFGIDSNNPEILVNLVIAYEQTCQWDQLDPLYGRLDQTTKLALAQGELPMEDPMLNIRRTDDLALNRAVAQVWSQQAKAVALRLAKPFIHTPPRFDKRRITIGYLSYDFRNHPVGHQIYPLFQLHDRSRFRVIAFSMGPDDGSFYRRRIKAFSDRFIDISACGLTDAARTIKNQDVDILVDLMGHSHHNRLGILALRPAPIQIGYLGFLSTTGADYIDYLITDDVVIPREHRGYYCEQLIRMPNCYQINHIEEISPPITGCRKDWNLPTGAFVFCCFNVAYKIDRRVFHAWMRILDQSPNAVLWLFGGNPLVIDQLRTQAKNGGIDPDRLIFAEQLPLGEHLRRLPMADLALDTLRYNGGATTANALRAGVPVLTVMGHHWVSRMSASHLKAVGLPELVARDLEAYERMALALYKFPDRLTAVKDRLVRHYTENLFNPSGFVRALENQYRSVWKRYLHGKAPVATKVPHWKEDGRRSDAYQTDAMETQMQSRAQT